ncbi:MAG: RagB/SusD family nutrient uptake outer membrane protein, partial [Saprospiraceae bacterium]
ATKFSNLKSDGTPGSDQTFVDTDFPLFRVEDASLMYAEAVRRGGGGGDIATAVNLVNQLRERAYLGTGGNITANDMTLDFILDERSRELFWEGHRRSDLIRFGKFSTSTYLWPWKGGVAAGVTRPAHFDVFPIPNSDIGANPNLRQNSGY